MDTDNKYGMLDAQKEFLPILDHIDAICKKNHINYTISDGTLIGAVRHKGFVPWDDDIDISFDRTDYNKFIKVLRKDLGAEYTVVRDMWVRRITRKDNPLKNAVPPEQCVDLFVFDNVPDNAFLNGTKNLLIKVLQGMMKREVNYGGFSFLVKAELFITHLLGRAVSLETKQKWFDRVSQWGNNKKCKNKARYSCSFRYISKVRYPACITSEYTTVEFEGKQYMAVKQWDTFLSTDYGDYMKLPPEDKRIAKHKKRPL